MFPIGSPLVRDVSRAVLNVTEGDKMVKIEKASFGQTSCPDSGTSFSSTGLSLESFWGLFLIVGIASFSALIIYIVLFIHKHKQVLQHLDPRASILTKFVVLGKHFDTKDLSCHTFRKNELQDKSTSVEAMDIVGAQQVSPNGDHPPSP